LDCFEETGTEVQRDAAEEISDRMICLWKSCLYKLFLSVGWEMQVQTRVARSESIVDEA
jgi:hypothetical protein